jgi:hypothetical protein
MLPLQIHQKFVDGFGKDADSTQPPHVGFYMYRVEPLFVHIDLENLCQFFSAGAEYFVYKTIADNDIAVAPQCFRTEVFGIIRLFCDI